MALKDRLYDVPVVGTGVRVQDRYQEDAGDQFAGSIGFFGFLSLFPILLLALSITGFVLADAPEERVDEVAETVAQTVQDAIPGFAAALGGGDDATSVGQALDSVIANRNTAGGLGLVLLLLSGLRVVNAAQTATLVVFRVDRGRLVGLMAKVRQVGALAGLGLLALAGAVAGGAIGGLSQREFPGAMDVLAPVVATAATFVLDTGLFLAAYRVFGTRDGPPVSTLVPGAVLAGAGWTALKLAGSTYVSGQVDRASNLYGALGGVIGLMLLLYLAGRLYVYGAELSAVRAPNPAEPSETAEEAGIESRVDDDDTVAAAGAAGAPPTAAGAPLFDRHPARSPSTSAPSTAQAAAVAPAASDATRRRLMGMPEPSREQGQGRHALAFALAVGAVAGLVGALRPWEQD